MADIQQITPAMEIAEREVARTLRREKSAGQSVMSSCCSSAC
ncbi:ABC transporter permease protein YesQ [Raoultella ornithinolytica]|nr:ABC transporter permease protein YesQ [Raoultella ornithinolytica]